MFGGIQIKQYINIHFLRECATPCSARLLSLLVSFCESLYASSRLARHTNKRTLQVVQLRILGLFLMLQFNRNYRGVYI